MSVLRIPALLAGVASLVAGCMDDGTRVRAEPVPGTERFSSGITTRQRMVIRDTPTWENAWLQIVSAHGSVPPVPVVDFASHTVIVAAMGTRPTGGYSIDVDDVRLYLRDASIHVTEESPGPGCIVITSETHPIDVVMVPRFTGAATFFEDSEERSCR